MVYVFLSDDIDSANAYEEEFVPEKNGERPVSENLLAYFRGIG